MTKQTLSYPVYNLQGKIISEEVIETSSVDPAKYTKLIAQIVRVFLSNQRQGTASTKTRGEVEGSTRKIYRQKGTGRARHGDIKAPIFVGGGIIFGPHPRDFTLKVNKKMKKKAFLVSLIDKISNKKFIVLDGLEKMPAKTKNFYHLTEKILGGLKDNLKKKMVLLIEKGNKNLYLASRNIPFITSSPPATVNTYQILTHEHVFIEKNAVDDLFRRVGLVRKSPVKKVVKSKKAKKTIRRKVEKK